MSCPAMTPIMSREPVPELPKSSGPGGWLSPPTPRPSTSQCRSRLDAGAPRAATARAVLITSSASSSPRMRVRPVARAPRISARCEMDLSPGTRTRPKSGPLLPAVRGRAGDCFTCSIAEIALADGGLREGTGLCRPPIRVR